MKSLQQLFDEYVKLVEKDDVEGAGDLVVEVDDDTCKQLYAMLVADERTKNKLVRPLWYNYRTQKMRWQ